MEEMTSMAEHPGRIQRGQILLLSAAHLVNDAYAGFLAPLLPLLVEKFGLSLTAAGFLSSILSFSASMVQPLYGYLADRLGRRYFVVLGPLLTSIFMSSIGVPGSYTLLVLIVFVGGMGTAFFHPQGAALAGAAGGHRKGFGMSLFSAGGNAGYALGPLFILPIVSVWGLGNSYVAVVPGLLISVLLYRYIVHARLPSPTQRETGTTGSFSLHFKPLLLLWLIVFLRALVVTAYGTFIPLLLIERGFSLMIGGASITIFLLCGAVGGLLGGYLSDRVGRRMVILLSFILTTPLLLVFLYTSKAASTLGLALGGAALLASVPVVLVMAQELMPERVSTVSADAIGLTTTLAMVAFLPLLGCLCGLGLPER
jgi:FSR family fosmidomycin resistance protein-like MFS transporter